MLTPKNLEAIAQQLHNALPQSLKNVGNDLDEKFRQILQAQLVRLDVVTREEFDVQSQVLLRTREKLNELEKRLDRLAQEKTSPTDSTI